MRVVSVSYLNTLPFIYGLKENGNEVETAYPAECASLLHQHKADVALIPIGALESDREYYIHSHFGIGCNGAVRTVKLFGDRPKEEWDTIYLDYQSRTSVILTELIVRQLWKLPITLLPSEKGYEEQIGGATGGLIIGDRSFQYESKYAYQYDLGEIWTNWTTYPFIFAIWASLTPLTEASQAQLSDALAYGLAHFASSDLASTLPGYAKNYYRDNISFQFSARYWDGFHYFNTLSGRSNIKCKSL